MAPGTRQIPSKRNGLRSQFFTLTTYQWDILKQILQRFITKGATVSENAMDSLSLLGYFYNINLICKAIEIHKDQVGDYQH